MESVPKKMAGQGRIGVGQGMLHDIYRLQPLGARRGRRGWGGITGGLFLVAGHPTAHPQPADRLPNPGQQTCGTPADLSQAGKQVDSVLLDTIDKLSTAQATLGLQRWIAQVTMHNTGRNLFLYRPLALPLSNPQENLGNSMQETGEDTYYRATTRAARQKEQEAYGALDLLDVRPLIYEPSFRKEEMGLTYPASDPW